MTLREALAAATLVPAAFFFLTGTVGLLRFPDLYLRLHAITKADNLGLGFTVVALAIEAGSVATACKLFVIWGLVLLASGTNAQLMASTGRRVGLSPRLGR